jgi:hypothetical protein
LKDFGVLKLIFFSILKNEAVFFDKIEERIAPDGRGKVLLDIIVDPLFILAQFVLFFLLFFLLLLPEQPLQHAAIIRYLQIIS